MSNEGLSQAENSKLASDTPPDIKAFLEIRKRYARRMKLLFQGKSMNHSEHIPPELREIAELYKEIAGGLNPVEIYTATTESRDREKAIFLEAFCTHTSYQPQFESLGSIPRSQRAMLLLK